MVSSVIESVITMTLSGAGVCIHFHYKRYQDSLDQAQKVRRVMEDVLTSTAGLFRQKKTAQELKPELPAILRTLNQELRRLNDMTICLPLKLLQREQRHVLRHGVWLSVYLASHQADNDGKFFLFLHDVAMGCDEEVASIRASLHSGQKHRRSGIPVNLKTCP